jgi:hypothetical protein
MAYNYETGSALQVIHTNVAFPIGGSTTSAYTYTDIPGTNATLTVSKTGSTLYLQCYVNGWGNGGSGGNIAFKINGTIAGSSSSGNGDSWCRALNGASGNRSYNIGRAMLYKHGLQAGSQISVNLCLGTWNVAGIYAGWTSHPTFLNLTLIELDTI